MKKSGRREPLPQLIKRLRREKDLSLAQVETNSGGRITNGHVNRIENGHTENLTSDKIQALADGLQVSPYAICESLFDIVVPIDPREEEIVSHFRLMPEIAKAFLLLIARAFRGQRAEYVPLDSVTANAYVEQQVRHTKKQQIK